MDKTTKAYFGRCGTKLFIVTIKQEIVTISGVFHGFHDFNNFTYIVFSTIVCYSSILPTFVGPIFICRGTGRERGLSGSSEIINRCQFPRQWVRNERLRWKDVVPHRVWMFQVRYGKEVIINLKNLIEMSKRVQKTYVIIRSVVFWGVCVFLLNFSSFIISVVRKPLIIIIWVIWDPILES